MTVRPHLLIKFITCCFDSKFRVWSRLVKFVMCCFGFSIKYGFNMCPWDTVSLRVIFFLACGSHTQIGMWLLVLAIRIIYYNLKSKDVWLISLVTAKHLGILPSYKDSMWQRPILSPHGHLRQFPLVLHLQVALTYSIPKKSGWKCILSLLRL